MWVPQAGRKLSLDSDGRVKLSRIIVIEDADYLGNLRQAYLRRMMEQSSLTSRFIFTTTTPSRLIEALRSRVQHIRLSRYDNKLIEQRLTRIVNEENLQPARGMIGDIAHVSEGNIRKVIFLLELLSNGIYSLTVATSSIWFHQPKCVKYNKFSKKR